MRALSLTLLFLPLLFVAGPGMLAHAASLSEGQVRSIILLLESFGAEPSVVTSVNASLRGETLSPVSTPAQSDPTAGFTHTLYLGSFGDDVSRLQMFLKKFPDIYPEGLITGYYGSLTQRATERFQKKYGIVSRGTPQTTGYGLVGPKTRTMLNYLLAKQATSAIPAIPTPVATIPEPSSAPATASMTVSTEASGESQPITVVARAASETTQTTQTTNTNTANTNTTNTQQMYTLTITRPTNGTITGTGISCGTSASDCTETYTGDVVVSMRATPASGYSLNAWTNCSATNTICTLGRLSRNTTLGAVFTSNETASTTPPIISNVSGTFTDGNTITITGSNFKLGPRVHLFDDFEGGVAGQRIPLTSPKVGVWTGDNSLATRLPRYHDYSASGDLGFAMVDYITVPGTANNSSLNIEFPNEQEIFVSYNVAVPPGSHFPASTIPNGFSDSISSSWKFMWLMDTPTGYGTDELYDVVLLSQAGYGSCMIGGNSILVTYVKACKDWWDFDGFNHIAVWLRPNMNDLFGNGTAYFQATNNKNGTTKQTYIKPVFKKGVSTRFNRLSVPGWSRGGEKSQGVYDDVYVALGANASARIEVSDSAVYDQSSIIAISTPMSWSDSQITLTFREGGLQNGTAYLYVIDKDNIVSTPYEVTVRR